MIDKDKFCVVPFVQLNTRGKGDARVCCSIGGIDHGIPKDLVLDEINPDTYNSNTEVFNLGSDNIPDLWNSKFMKDFRMKMLNGENIPNCEFCHRMEAGGLTSKRIGKNSRFLEKTLPLLEKYKEKNGYVDVMPQWWEIRLSTKCNLSCIMCTPGLSSMMYKEYNKWEKQGTIADIMKGSLDIAKESGEEYLSKSEFFRNQILDNLDHCLFMEFRGGEVFSDVDSIRFIEEISKTPQAKNIQLDISTNATLLDNKIVEILNRFAGGTLRYSIDSFHKEDELIRYHTKWTDVIASMDTCLNLHNDWRFLTQTTLQMLNCLSMDKLIVFLNEYIEKNNLDRFWLGFTTVRGKDYLRHEMVTNELRNQQIKKLELLKTKLYIFTKHKNKEIYLKSLDMLINTLKTQEYNNNDLRYKAKYYFETLNANRGIDYFDSFKHLKESVEPK